MQFYTKNDAGEFIPADEAVEQYAKDYLRKKSGEIVSERLSRYKKSEGEKLRKELENNLRKEIDESVRSEVKNEIEAEYSDKLSEANSKVSELEIELRRKNIAAEYGLGQQFEQFLGDGDEDEMRGKADILKNNRTAIAKFPEKSSSDKESGFVTLVDA